MKQVTISNVKGRSPFTPGGKGITNFQYISNGNYLCDVACTFGEAGTYTFDVSAPGAKTQTLTVTVPERVTGRGGCGVSEIDGNKQTLNLVFEPLTN